MSDFRHDCTKRQECWLDRRWNPAFVGKAYLEKFGKPLCQYSSGKGCTPTDVDGFMERNGRCLFIETKTAGAPMSAGQHRALMALVDAGHHVIVQECDPPNEDHVVKLTWYRSGDTPILLNNASSLERDKLIQRWWDWAGKAGQQVAA